MKEQQLQAKKIKQLEALGWYVVKIIKCNKNGMPDLIAFKGKEFIFIEMKTAIGKISQLQKYRIEELRNHGFTVDVCYG